MALKIQIHIRDDKTFYGKTNAAKPWENAMNAMRGQWVDVETEYLFANQFNVASVRVSLGDIDGIRFIDCTFQDFQEAVLKRYEKDWPGSIETTKQELHRLKKYLENNFHELTTFGDKLVYLPSFEGSYVQHS